MMAPVGDRDDRQSAQDRSEDDWDLIRRIGAGDQTALEKLYRQYYGGLSRFVLQVTRRNDLVEEVINEVMFVVWQKASAVEPRSRASTWILGIAHNKALQQIRRSSPRGLLPGEEYDAVDAVADEHPALRRLETDELLFALMQALSPEQRAVMELVYYHGLHYSEIAEVIDCPENTVKSRVFHARRRLRALWPELTGSKAQPTQDTRDR